MRLQGRIEGIHTEFSWRSALKHYLEDSEAQMRITLRNKPVLGTYASTKEGGWYYHSIIQQLSWY
jgi:hypothetical protein